jgi:aspartyl protease family protein
MDSDSLARLAYLALLACAVIGALFALYRGRLRSGVRDALLWGLIFLGFVAAYGLKDDIAGALDPSQAVMTEQGAVLLRRGPDGHFRLQAEVNGAPVTFLVDTGATDVVLTREAARRAGLDPDALRYTRRAQTANGIARFAPVRLERLEFAGLSARDVPAAVSEGRLFTSLLGMSYLDRFRRISVEGDRMLLSP